MKFERRIRKGTKGDSSDFLSISETDDLQGFSRTAVSGVYGEQSEKGENIQRAAVFWAKPEVRGEWADWFEMKKARKGNGNSNNHSLQLRYAEDYV